MTINPVTREEMYLAKAAGQDVETPEPITRKEMLLNKIAENGGGGVTSWNDLTDRPFYEKPDEYEATWDGNMEGRIVLDMEVLGLSGVYLVKVSDKVYTKEELIGKTIADIDGTENTIDANNVIVDLPGAFWMQEDGLAIVYSADQLSAAFNVPDGYIENGTYFMTAPSSGFYTSDLYTKGYLVKMDEKFLPSSTLKILKIVSTSADRVRCALEGGWTEAVIDWSDGSPWSETIEHIPGGILVTRVDVDVDSNNTLANYVAFVMTPVNDNSCGSGFVYYDSYGLSVQIFIRVNAVEKRVYVAAKTLTISQE